MDMASKRFVLLSWGAACALAFVPASAYAQHCRVSAVEVPPVQVRVGAREQLLIIFRDPNGLPCDQDPSYTARSNNNAVARFEDGYIIGVSAGQAVVTVRTGVGHLEKSGVASIVVTAEAPSTPTGVTAPPSVAPTPAPAPTAPVPAGDHGPGTATLQYQPQGGTAPAAGIVTDPERLLLLPGESRFLGYRTADVNGGNAQPMPLQFAVEPAAALAFVTVDSIGVVTAIDTGRATIRVSAVGHPNITSLPVPVIVHQDSVLFASTQVNMPPRQIDTVVMQVPAQNRAIDVRSRVYQFESSDTSVAMVHLWQPVIESRAPGHAVVTARNPRLPSVTVAVNVFPLVTAIQLPDTSLTVAVRQTRTVTMRPVADTTYIRDAPFALSGLDTTRLSARYDTTTGTFALTGRASGLVALTMRVQNGSDTTGVVQRTLRVRVVAGGLQLSRTRVGMGMGEHAPLEVALLDDARHPLPGVTPDVAWTSSDTGVARMDGGQILARGVGHARLTARTPWDSMATVDVYVGADMLIVKQRQGAWNIFGKSASGWTQVTHDSLVESFPTWSPDLTRVAYVVRPANHPSGGDLYVANADGSDPRRVFGIDSAVVNRPDFVRPSGDQIVFELHYPSDGHSEIWQVGLDGTNPHRLAVGTAGTFTGYPAVSPDGRRILYTSIRAGQGSYDVYVASLDGTGERRLTTYRGTDDSPEWAPDGQSYFFLRDLGSVDHHPSKLVFHGLLASDSAVAASHAGEYVQSFAVSSDGNTLALTELDPSNVAHLSLYDMHTATETPVPLDPGESISNLSPVAWRPTTPAAPASPAAAAAHP